MGIFTNDKEAIVGTPEPKAYHTERPITAAAAMIRVSDTGEIDALKNRKGSQRWQDEAWDYFDLIGEIKYAYSLFANILSRIRIHAAYLDGTDNPPTPLSAAEGIDPELLRVATEAMNEAFGAGKQSQILRKAAISILVAGECYLISEPKFRYGYPVTEWKIVSSNELITLDKGFGIKKRADMRDNLATVLPKQAFIGRIWKEHPRYSDEPDSAMKALCEICNELLLLNRTVRATARSRLNAGALFVPDEFSLSQDTPTDQDYDTEEGIEAYVDDSSDEFEEQLIEAMTTPISDESSASAVVPLLIRGPSELGEKIKHIKFERAFDPQLTNRADRALERILQGIDMPKEMITGLSNIKYSNAVQISESFYTGHIEPLMIMLCDAFRQVYLEPYLYRAGLPHEEIQKVVIWYDPSGITTAPDKSAAANVGYDKYLISGDAWRTANGFSPEDAPQPEEVVRRMVTQRGAITPELTDTVLADYVPELLKQVRAATLEESAAPIPEDVENLLSPPNDPSEAPADPADPVETTEGAEGEPLEGIFDSGTSGEGSDEDDEMRPPPELLP